MKDIGKFWNRKRWTSICSKHTVYDKNCNLCNTGRWVNLWKSKIGTIIFKITPQLWVWWVNR